MTSAARQSGEVRAGVMLGDEGVDMLAEVLQRGDDAVDLAVAASAGSRPGLRRGWRSRSAARAHSTVPPSARRDGLRATFERTLGRPAMLAKKQFAHLFDDGGGLKRGGVGSWGSTSGRLGFPAAGTSLSIATSGGKFSGRKISIANLSKTQETCTLTLTAAAPNHWAAFFFRRLRPGSVAAGPASATRLASSAARVCVSREAQKNSRRSPS